MMLKEHIVETYGADPLHDRPGLLGRLLPVHDRLDVPRAAGRDPAQLQLHRPVDDGARRHRLRPAGPLLREEPAPAAGCPRSTVTATRATARPGTPSSTTCRTRRRRENCKLPDDQVYDPVARPDAVRCNIQDYQEAIWGPRPKAEWGPVEKQIGKGFANRPWGNAGVQYGLRALESGEDHAGRVRRHQRQDRRPRPSITSRRRSARRSTRTPPRSPTRRGQVTDPRQLANVPIIDLRAYSETGEIHTSFYSYKLRARLDQANGGHANMLIWTFPGSTPILGVAPPKDIVLKSFLLMDEWLARIESDTSGAPLAAEGHARQAGRRARQLLLDGRLAPDRRQRTGGRTRSTMPAQRSTRTTATRARQPAAR